MAVSKIIQKIRGRKSGEKIVMVTSYDFVTASLIRESGIDIVLVGDSVGNVLLGYKNTAPVTMDDMLHHVRAVCRANLAVPVVADMPNNSYGTAGLALKNAKKFLEAGADDVKVEGAVVEVVRALVENNIPVMGHVGLTPQSVTDWKVQGRDEKSAQKIFGDALALENAGCFCVVIESVPRGLAKKISAALKVPTIGIGAGPSCDGQVLVINDLLGFNATEFRPRFVKQYLDLRPQVVGALKKFCHEVKSGAFPANENSYN